MGIDKIDHKTCSAWRIGSAAGGITLWVKDYAKPTRDGSEGEIEKGITSRGGFGPRKWSVRVGKSRYSRKTGKRSITADK